MKLTTVTIILTLFTWISCQAQENRFELGLGVFPNFSIGIVTNDGSVPGEVESGFQDIEIAKPSISSCLSSFANCSSCLTVNFLT